MNVDEGFHTVSMKTAGVPFFSKRFFKPDNKTLAGSKASASACASRCQISSSKQLNGGLYHGKHQISFFCQFLHELWIRMGSDNNIYAELPELFRFLCWANHSCDIDFWEVGRLQELIKDRAADVAWLIMM